LQLHSANRRCAPLAHCRASRRRYRCLSVRRVFAERRRW
jgi:hypothetical protein